MTPLEGQIRFLALADQLKKVDRLNTLRCGTRRENSAEHSWHAALCALTLAEHAEPGTNINEVVEILLIHDLVEIHAGDHWVTEENQAEVARKEAAALEEVAALLPVPQAQTLKSQWQAFESGSTREARFAAAIDALAPMLQTFAPGATAECHAPLSAAEMRARKARKLRDFPALWALAQEWLTEAQSTGKLLP